MFYRRDLMSLTLWASRRSWESEQHCGREIGGSVEASKGHLEGKWTTGAMRWFPELQADLGKHEARNLLKPLPSLHGGSLCRVCYRMCPTLTFTLVS